MVDQVAPTRARPLCLVLVSPLLAVCAVAVAVATIEALTTMAIRRWLP